MNKKFNIDLYNFYNSDLIDLNPDRPFLIYCHEYTNIRGNKTQPGVLNFLHTNITSNAVNKK